MYSSQPTPPQHMTPLPITTLRHNMRSSISSPSPASSTAAGNASTTHQTARAVSTWARFTRALSNLNPAHARDRSAYQAVFSDAKSWTIAPVLPNSRAERTARRKVSDAFFNPVVVCIFGLDNAGKSTVFMRLKGENGHAPKASWGFTTQKLDIKPRMGLRYLSRYKRVPNTQAILYDVGGSSKIRNIWKNYLAEAHACIFVVDGADPSRFEEAAEALRLLYLDPRMQGKPLTILVNKQDNDLSTKEIDNIVVRLNLMDLTDTMCRHMSQEPDPPILKLIGNAGILGNSILIQPCTASIQSISRFLLLPRQVCDANIMSAFLWTLEKVHSMLPTLSARIEQDMAQQRIAWDREKEEQRKRVEAARLKATLAPGERVSSMQAAEQRKDTTAATAAIPADVQQAETQLCFPNERDSSISVNTEPLSHESEDLVSCATPMPTVRKDTVDSATTEENTSTDIRDGAVVLNDEDNLSAQTPTMEPDSPIQGLNQQVGAAGESPRKEQGKHESLFPLPPPRPEALSGTVKRSPRPKASGKTKRKQIPQSQQHQIQRKQRQVDKTGAVDAVCQSIDVESTMDEKQPNELQPKRTDDTGLDEYKLPSAEIIPKSKTSPTPLPTPTISTTSDTSAPIIPISLAAAAMSRKILLPPIGKSGTTAAAAEVTSLGKSLDNVSGPAGRKEGLSDVRDSAVCVVE